MKKINLRDYYPFYNKNVFIDVPDKIADTLSEAERQERTYRRRMYRYKAEYSLDKDDGIEHEILFVSLSPCEIFEQKVTYERLHAAIASLPDKQARRIYAYYFLGISKAAIARSEGVGKAAVCESLSRGLKNIERFLKNIF